VLGIDVEIRNHNREAIEAHPLYRRIEMLEGSSVAPEIVTEVVRRAEGKQSILVCLDSNHTHDHVLEDLRAYAPLVTPESYCVVFDTVIENLPGEMFPDRPWGPGDNPMTAVLQYLDENNRFEIDHRIDHKLLISVAPCGYLKRCR
jgi:cephalosporin hydroxylase